MTLIDLQRDMSAWLQIGGDAEADRFLAEAQAGLAIYQNNYRAQLIECLASSFQVTCQWLGDDDFRAAAAEHIDAVPPSSWTLDAYPRDFPATLQRGYPDDAEVFELARLELALAEAFVATDAAAIDPATLAGVDWDTARLVFTPSLDLDVLITNAPAIWAAIVDEEPPPAAHTLEEPAGLVIWRHDDLARFRAASAQELHAIRLARAGTTFGALCALLVDAMGEADGVAAAGGWLGQWVADGLIVGID